MTVFITTTPMAIAQGLVSGFETVLQVGRNRASLREFGPLIGRPAIRMRAARYG